jgi:hypothetical protein
MSLVEDRAGEVRAYLRGIRSSRIWKSLWRVPAIRKAYFRLDGVRRARLRKNIIRYLEENAQTPEEKRTLEYLGKNPLSFLLPDPSAKYNPADIEVHRAEGGDLSYVMRHGKKIFFPKSMTREEIVTYYRDLSIEQDPSSPHYYFSNGAAVQEGDVVVDVGASEGIFALDIVETANKVYVIEGDQSWIRPLEETFRPWKDKVTIMPKYVSDSNTEHYATLDSLFHGVKVNFVKMDIEGFEEGALKGADTLLSNAELTVVVAAYHNKRSETSIRKILAEKGFVISTSNGYVVLIYDVRLTPPYLRRGLVIGKK